ncbi:Csa1 family protein, partial [Staphylococcus epidermidis]|uniref:Csa1 family protein n=1 Tax=Staphylococcus epidermidis TaxID=1282 RepID=UPI00119CF753
NLEHYNNPNLSYNPNLPSYSPEYQLTNQHHNLKHLTNKYHIPTKNPPKLILKPHPHLKPSSIPYKQIHFSFLHNKEQNIYFPHTFQFNPTHLNNH